MPMPLINFQPVNPMDTLIKSALGVYGGINENRQRQAQTDLTAKQMELIEAQLPYAAKIQAAQLGLTNAQMAQALANAKNQEIMNDLIRSKMPGAGGSPRIGQPAPAGQTGVMTAPNVGGSSPIGAPSLPINSLSSGYAGSGAMQNAGGMGAPSAPAPMAQQSQQMQDNDPYPGPSEDQVFINRLLKQPDMSPQQQAEVDLWKERRKKQMEQNLPTTQTISDTQSRLKGVEGTLPIIEDLLKMSVPHQVGTPIPFTKGKYADTFSAERQAAYEAKLSNAMESYLAALGQRATAESLHVVEKALGRKAWESEEAYKERLKDEWDTLINTYERLGGEKGKYQRKGEHKGEANQEDPLGIR